MSLVTYRIGLIYNSLDGASPAPINFKDGIISIVQPIDINNMPKIRSDPQIYQHEVTLQTDSIYHAICIMHLVIGSLSILDSIMDTDFDFFEWNIKTQDPRDRIIYGKNINIVGHSDDMPFYACLIAGRAYDNAPEQNAILKYSTARQMIDIWPNDLHPIHGAQFTWTPSHNIRAAYATILC